MIYIRDMRNKKKYLIKGITEQQYRNDDNYTDLYDKIYKLLIKHDIQDAEIINEKGERLDLWKRNMIQTKSIDQI